MMERATISKQQYRMSAGLIFWILVCFHTVSAAAPTNNIGPAIQQAPPTTNTNGPSTMLSTTMTTTSTTTLMITGSPESRPKPECFGLIVQGQYKKFCMLLRVGGRWSFNEALITAKNYPQGTLLALPDSKDENAKVLQTTLDNYLISQVKIASQLQIWIGARANTSQDQTNFTPWTWLPGSGPCCAKPKPAEDFQLGLTYATQFQGCVTVNDADFRFTSAVFTYPSLQKCLAGCKQGNYRFVLQYSNDDKNCYCLSSAPPSMKFDNPVCNPNDFKFANQTCSDKFLYMSYGPNLTVNMIRMCAYDSTECALLEHYKDSKDVSSLRIILDSCTEKYDAIWVKQEDFRKTNCSAMWTAFRDHLNAKGIRLDPNIMWYNRENNDNDACIFKSKNATMTWFEAVNLGSEQGGSLVTILDGDIEPYQNWIKSFKLPPFKAWIGLSTMPWRWLPQPWTGPYDVNIFTTNKFSKGYPSSTKKDSQCAYIDGYTRMWESKNCADKVTGFLQVFSDIVIVAHCSFDVPVEPNCYLIQGKNDAADWIVQQATENSINSNYPGTDQSLTGGYLALADSVPELSPIYFTLSNMSVINNDKMICLSFWWVMRGDQLVQLFVSVFDKDMMNEELIWMKEKAVGKGTSVWKQETFQLPFRTRTVKFYGVKGPTQSISSQGSVAALDEILVYLPTYTSLRCELLDITKINTTLLGQLAPNGGDTTLKESKDNLSQNELSSLSVGRVVILLCIVLLPYLLP